jgi:hypothetical protein
MVTIMTVTMRSLGKNSRLKKLNIKYISTGKKIKSVDPQILLFRFYYFLFSKFLFMLDTRSKLILKAIHIIILYKAFFLSNQQF